MSKNDVEQVLTAEIGDTVNIQGIKGEVVAIEHLRDLFGNLQVTQIVRPDGADKKEKEPMPKGYEVKGGKSGHGLYYTGNGKNIYLGAPLEVAAEVIYPQGDRGFLLHWSVEYADDDGNKRTVGGWLIINKSILEEDGEYLLRRFQQGGYPLLKNCPELAERYRDYLVKSEPVLKAFCGEMWRDYGARYYTD